MHEDNDHTVTGSRDPQSFRRPPYGLPLRDRPRHLTTSDSLGWRTYATPAPPRASTVRTRDRLTRPAIIASILACVGFGIWSSTWSTDSACPRTNAATMPPPRVSVAERSIGLTSPLPSTPAPPTPPPSATPNSRPKMLKGKAISSENRHRSTTSAAPRKRPENPTTRPRRKTTTRVDHTEEPKRIDRKDGSKNRLAPLIAAKCDELFPPSRPEFRIRNRACHLFYG